MDEYFLSKDEWDTLVELGVGSHKDELVLKKVTTATKTSFTKKCVVITYPVCC
jgi:replication factor C subunit 1